MSWSLFRTYLSANVQSDKLEHIAFEALVYDKNQYHIVIDRHNLFGEIFKKIIAGTYARECIDKGLLNEWHEKCQTDANFNISMDEYAKKLFKINGNNPVKNLKEYIKWKNSDSVMTVLRDDGEYYYYKYVFENIAQQIETYSNDQTNDKILTLANEYIRTFNQELKFDLFKTQTLIATISIALDKLNLINDERFHPLIDKSVLHCTDLKGHLEELIIKEANNYVEVGLKGAILNGHTISANLTGKILGIFQSIIKALSSQTAGSSEAALVAVVPGSVNLCLKATASSYDPPIYSTTNILNAIFSAETNNYRQYFENNKTHTKALEPIIKFCEVLAENELNVMIKATNIIGGDKASVNISYDKANECKGIFTEIRNNLERQEKTLIFDGLVDGYRLTKKTVWLLWIENGKQIEVKYDKNQEEIILRISNERLTAKFEVKQITEIKKNKKTNKTVTLYELVHVVDDQTEREYL